MFDSKTPEGSQVQNDGIWKPVPKTGFQHWFSFPRTSRLELVLALIPACIAGVYCLLAFLLPPREDVPDIIQWPEGIAPGTTTPVAEASARHSFPSLVALYWPEILVCSVTLVCLTIYAVVVLRARVRRRMLAGGAIQITEG